MKGRSVAFVAGLLLAVCGAVGVAIGPPRPPDGTTTVQVAMRPGPAPSNVGERRKWSVVPDGQAQQAGDAVCVVNITTETAGGSMRRRPGSLPATTIVTATLAVNDAAPALAEEMKEYSCLTQIAGVVEQRTRWPTWAKAVRRIGESVEVERPGKLLWWCLAALGGVLVFASGVLNGQES